MTQTTARAGGFNEDERTAGRLLALVLDLLGRTRPMPLRDVDARHFGDLSAGAARRRHGRTKDTLAECGIRIVQARDAQRFMTWAVDSRCMSSGPLPAQEARLIRALAAPLMDDPGYLPWRPYLRMALGKVCESPASWRSVPLPPAARGEADADPRVTSTIATCMAQGLSVEFDYVDAKGERSHRLVDPLGFFDLRGHSYLASALADGAAEGEARTFRCDRISRASATARPQKPHPHLDLTSFRKLPFQMGPTVATCTFDVSAVAPSQMAQIKPYHGELSTEGGTSLWAVDCSSLEDAAAWAVAMNARPVSPPQLVEAWRDVLALARTGEAGMLPSPVASPHTSGRNGPVRILRMLLAMAAGLTHEGGTVTAYDVERRFGVGPSEAHMLLELLLSSAGGDAEHEAFLHLGLQDDGTSLTALDDSACRLRALRLTPLEAAALGGALNKAGMPADDPIRERLRSSFWPLEGQLAEPDGPTDAPRTYPTLATCILSILGNRPLSFMYRGQRDAAPRERHVVATRVWQDGERWMLDARDLEAALGDDERTFVLAGIRHLRALDLAEGDGQARAPHSRERRGVELRFSDSHMLDLLEWPGVEFEETESLSLVGRTTYAGGNWLVRRIAAGGGTITTTDPELAQAVREYAASLAQA